MDGDGMSEREQNKVRNTSIDHLVTMAKGLGDVELDITTLVMERLRRGQDEYGLWPRRDHRNYVREALEENLDGLTYLAAELLRLEREEVVMACTTRVYTCHQFASDRPGATASLRNICRELIKEGCLPVCPQLFLPQFLEEHEEREARLFICQELVKDSDEVRVYGREITPHMRIEIGFAETMGLPVRYVHSAAEIA
jgi:hypothetical protein